MGKGRAETPIIARRAWAGPGARPRHAPGYGSIKLAFVHHTVNPNGYSAAGVPGMLRAIFDYHTQVRGWWDIGYNFVIDAYGRIWEARAGGIDMPVVGAQAGAYNAESTGVSMLGDLMNVTPSPAATAALEQLLAWKLSLHGVPATGRTTVLVAPADASFTRFRPGAHVSLPRIAGHRDGDLTDCPGNALYAELPAIRPRVSALAGNPARFTLAGQSVLVAAGSSAPLSGTLQLVRALHRPNPASVSDWVQVAVAPVLTLAAQSLSPFVLTGTVSPAKRTVTLALYRAGKLKKPVSHRRVTAVGGRFSARLPVPGAGNYVAIARTAADANNAPGNSSPLAVTIG